LLIQWYADNKLNDKEQQYIITKHLFTTGERRERERERERERVYVFRADEYASMHALLVLDGAICVHITRDCIDN
jgi:hypothetical protein